ncbi:hypothetical protein BT93_H1848 [Corymbia citriodora subsp. variegata]|nr:hypothetical protein BT93_H1848 [Corymbia citriodora subsp. variegata]
MITTHWTFCLKDDNEEFVFVVGQSRNAWSELDVIIQHAYHISFFSLGASVYFVLWLCD